MKSWWDLRNIEGPLLGVSEVVSASRLGVSRAVRIQGNPHMQNYSGRCLKTALDEVLAMHPKLQKFPQHSIICGLHICH